ncbi:MgtC/SapB family protein [Dehalogenimonas etheniformans]|uniref:MgtC/SapB family protein n=1 Tax=Dehalogenimonas etheniformans TaxID=1536648 RepID=A0A2P5P692_9CHLR|nr:MgtC/SapB family protein [Dehalogenimonas etheniformans]PPD57800.1 MgtC/SapB family protein [Dehalogenimonas etheniformans]QNT76141.1 MgtC/SapB family protein [Dehalogenimonas etheniformans]
MPDELVMIFRLVLAGALGAIIGFNREKAGKPAGIRTLALISIGAALFTMLSIFAFETADQARLAANIVTGIGFLGAGAIILRREQGIIEGMTTAATIWVMAAIGVAAGSGKYFVAVAAAVIVLLVLVLPHNERGSKKE